MTRTDPWLPGWGQWAYRLPKSEEDSMDLGYRLMAEQKRSERLSELLRESARRTVSWRRDFCDAEWGYAQQQNEIHQLEKKLTKEKKRRKTAEKIRDELIYHLDMARYDSRTATTSTEVSAPNREEIARILHDANTGKVCPDDNDPTRYWEMAAAVLKRFVSTEDRCPDALAKIDALWGTEAVGALFQYTHPQLYNAIDELVNCADTDSSYLVKCERLRTMLKKLTDAAIGVDTYGVIHREIVAAAALLSETADD